MPSSPAAVAASLAWVRPGRRRIVYEAGPTGYGLARHLRAAGFEVEVIAPGKTPVLPNREAKSDRLDCVRLVQYAEAGLLRAVTVPTIVEESDRQVLRLREQLVCKQRRAKQQIRSLPLQYGLAAPAGLGSWSQAARATLRAMRLPQRLRLCLDVLLGELEKIEELRRRVEAQMRQLTQTARHGKPAATLTSHPGVGTLTAMTFLTEVYRPERFTNGRQVAACLGLAPGIRASGASRRGGPLLKGGRSTLRRRLVEAAWSWAGHDERARQRYRPLVGNTGCPQKAIVAMARRLALNLWHMVRRGETYRAEA